MSKFITKTKGTVSRSQLSIPTHPLSGPVTIKHISDYSQEEQERWYNIKPATNADGKALRKPIHGPEERRNRG
jgi:hypothetical protein